MLQNNQDRFRWCASRTSCYLAADNRQMPRPRPGDTVVRSTILHIIQTHTHKSLLDKRKKPYLCQSRNLAFCFCFCIKVLLIKIKVWLDGRAPWSKADFNCVHVHTSGD